MLNKLLIKEELPHWIKKYDWEVRENKFMTEILLLKTDFPSEVRVEGWSNKNRIDEGKGTAPTMPIDEY